jgi:hypothetical protein
VVSDGEPWERLPGETTLAYSAFRQYRDLGPTRTVDQVRGVAPTSAQRWCSRWDWPARATAWDDEVHRLEDRHRLEAIRSMHETHQRAGRAAMAKAIAALQALQPAEIGASAAARLLELGARLERQTLLVSVDELQGRSPAVEDVGVDPWEVIARELQGTG